MQNPELTRARDRIAELEKKLAAQLKLSGQLSDILARVQLEPQKERIKLEQLRVGGWRVYQGEARNQSTTALGAAGIHSWLPRSPTISSVL